MQRSCILLGLIAPIVVGCQSQSTPVDQYGIDPVEITDENFEQVAFHSEQPVLLDIWQPGCLPCEQMEPGVRELAKEYEGRAVVARLNVDQALKAARRFQLAGLPTFVFFNGGRKVDHAVGLQTLPELRRRLDQMLAQNSPNDDE